MGMTHRTLTRATTHGLAPNAPSSPRQLEKGPNIYLEKHNYLPLRSPVVFHPQNVCNERKKSLGRKTSQRPPDSTTVTSTSSTHLILGTRTQTSRNIHRRFERRPRCTHNRTLHLLCRAEGRYLHRRTSTYLGWHNSERQRESRETIPEQNDVAPRLGGIRAPASVGSLMFNRGIAV